MSLINTFHGILGSIQSKTVYLIWIATTLLRDIDGAFYLTEYFGIKFYTIVIRKRMLSINDDFFARFIMVANKIVAFLLSTMLTFSREGLENEARFYGMVFPRISSPIDNG